MKLKKILFSLLAVFLLTLTVDAKTNSPTVPDGFSVEISHDFSYDVAVNNNVLLKNADAVNPVECFAPPLYVQLHDSYYIEVFEDKSGKLHYGKILYIPLLTYIKSYQGNLKNFKTITINDIDYIELGYSMKK